MPLVSIKASTLSVAERIYQDTRKYPGTHGLEGKRPLFHVLRFYEGITNVFYLVCDISDIFFVFTHDLVLDITGVHCFGMVVIVVLRRWSEAVGGVAFMSSCLLSYCLSQLTNLTQQSN